MKDIRLMKEPECGTEFRQFFCSVKNGFVGKCVGKKRCEVKEMRVSVIFFLYRKKNIV